MKRNPDEEYDNDRAKNKLGEVIHISQATSGKNGYYCIGCSAEMVAKMGPIMPDHFAHYAYDVEKRKHCIYYSETARHKLAKEILQRLKKVKVPNIKVFDREPGSKEYNIIKSSQFVLAYEVKNEMEFYRDEFNNVKFGRGITFKKKSEYKLLFKPDVAFFDKNQNPILLIELVSTHAVDENKIIKLKNLGIDTIQIKIPKTSSSEIENTFFNTTNTKWLYNYESENTEFKSRPTDQSIFEIDQFERELFERSINVKCRISEISNFIRKINKILGTAEFDNTRRKIESEIQSVDNSTEKENRDITRRRAEIRQTVYDRFSDSRRKIKFEEERFAREEREFREEEARFEQEENILENRYFAKDRELQERRSQLEQSKIEFEPECIKEIRRVERFLEENGAEPFTLGELDRRISNDRKSKEEFYNKTIDGIGADYRRAKSEIERIENEIRRVEQENSGLELRKRGEFEDSERKIREEYEGIRNATIEAIEREDSSRVPRIAENLNWAIFGREELTVQSSEGIKFRTLHKIEKEIEKQSFS